MPSLPRITNSAPKGLVSQKLLLPIPFITRASLIIQTLLISKCLLSAFCVMYLMHSTRGYSEYSVQWAKEALSRKGLCIQIDPSNPFEILQFHIHSFPLRYRVLKRLHGSCDTAGEHPRAELDSCKTLHWKLT